MAAVAGTGVGLYIVMNQDLSHGEGHDGHDGHDEHHDTPAKHEAVEESAPEEAKEEATEEKEDVKPEAATQEQSDEKPSETDKVRCLSGALLQSKLT